MAGSGDIRQKIVLEGEKEYSSSIKEAQRNLKTLRSELKAETAELGKNATEQQKTEVKTKNLQKQIAEQEKIVKANAKALQEVKEKYGDNADAVAKYEQKLNESRAALANMKNELESTGDGFKDLARDADTATVAAKAVSDTIGNLASVGDTVADSIESIFTGMLDTIKQAVGQVWQLIAETARKANSWTDLANAYGTTAEKVQRITAGLEWSGGSFDDLMTIIQKVNWNGDKKEGLLKDALGNEISDANYTDKLEYTMLVLSKLKELKETNGKKYDSIVEQVFGGKQGTRLSWFLDNWNTIQDKLREYDEGGYGMSTDELETMNDVWVELQTIEGKWDKLKEKFAAGFGTITLDIMTNVSGALDALSKYFNAETDEEREEALKQLEKNITDTFERVKTAIETGLKKLEELAEKLKESDNPTVQAIGNIMGGLVDVLQWFTEDNMTHVVDALEILAAFWIGGKALSMIGNITQLASQVAILKGAGGLGGLLGGASGAATTGLSLTVGEVAIAAGAVTLIASAFAWAADRRNNHPEEVRGTDENFEASTGGNEDLKSAFVEYVTTNRALQEFLNQGIIEGDEVEELFQKAEEAKQALDALDGSEEILKAYSDWLQEHSYGNMSWELPADWWQGYGDSGGLTSDDISGFRGLPGQMRAAVQSGVSNIKVVMDGQVVGNLVAPYVSEQIARDMA